MKFVMGVVALLLQQAQSCCMQQSVDTIRGVNYGNRFVPEEWMPSPYNFFEGVASGTERVSLCDVVDLPGGLSARDRMLNWLDATVQESHFEEMRSFGVDVIRLPVGYWNFITYPGSSTPNAPGDVAERLRNLQAMADPADYLPYLERIFAAAASYNQTVLIELHGAPGSQNGEMHSGCVTSQQEGQAYYFETDWNRDMAIRAVEEMSRLCVKFASSCFGVGLLNEPQGRLSHSFLEEYYRMSAVAARAILEPEHYIVAMDWTYNFRLWPDNAFDFGAYGRFLWDTHTYHFPSNGQTWTIEQAQNAFWWDLQQVESFNNRQNGTVFVGEYSLASMGDSYDEWARWLVNEFATKAAGSCFWHYDAPYDSWSMQLSARNQGVDWPSVFGA